MRRLYATSTRADTSVRHYFQTRHCFLRRKHLFLCNSLRSSQVFITQAIRILVPAGYETEGRASLLASISAVLIPLSIAVEISLR